MPTCGSILCFCSLCFYRSEIAAGFELLLPFDVLASLLGLAITSREFDNLPTCGVTFPQRSGSALDVPSRYQFWLISWMLNAFCAPPGEQNEYVVSDFFWFLRRSAVFTFFLLSDILGVFEVQCISLI